MIFKGSRYEKTPVLRLTKPTGEVIAYLATRFIPPTPAGFYHTVQSHERLDLLAFQFYRNPEKFWRIACARRSRRTRH